MSDAKALTKEAVAHILTMNRHEWHHTIHLPDKWTKAQIVEFYEKLRTLSGDFDDRLLATLAEDVERIEAAEKVIVANEKLAAGAVALKRGKDIGEWGNNAADELLKALAAYRKRWPGEV